MHTQVSTSSIMWMNALRKLVSILNFYLLSFFAFQVFIMYLLCFTMMFVGADNVVQVVMDNASNNMGAKGC